MAIGEDDEISALFALFVSLDGEPMSRVRSTKGESMDEKRREEISQALSAKGVDRPCPRCGNLQFDVVSEFSIILEEGRSEYSMGGRSIPTVIVACDKCGYVVQHALRALGLAAWKT